MHDNEIEALRAAIAALESQRATLGDAALELATAPLRARQASVIGRVFWDDALQALDAQAPRALPALQRAAFVKARDTSDFEGTAEHQFDHHLLHQVTYDTLLKAERKLGHARRRAGWPSAPRAAARSSCP